MAISSVGASGFQPVSLPTAAAKPADTDAPSTAAPAAQKASDGGADKDAPSASESSSSSSAVNLTKINPDGTIGPMHLHRHANSPGVFHA